MEKLSNSKLGYTHCECMSATEVAQVLSCLNGEKVVYSLNPMFEGQFYKIEILGYIPETVYSDPYDESDNNSLYKVFQSLYGDE